MDSAYLAFYGVDHNIYIYTYIIYKTFEKYLLGVMVLDIFQDRISKG